MDAMLLIGRLVGVVGVLICAAAVVVRLGGHFLLSGYQVGTLFLAGIAAMVAGCLCLLWSLASRR
jgi:hypothetical protein